MGTYICKLLYLSGDVKRKILKEEELRNLEGKKEPIVLSASPIPDPISKAISTVNKLLLQVKIRSVKTSELIDFSRSMATTLRAGISVLNAMEDYADVTTNRFFKSVIEDVINEVRGGRGLSSALEKYPKVFPPIFIRLIRIGEETGRLEKSFGDIADHLTRVESLRSSIKRALMYPSFVLFVSFGALIFWLAYVFPKIADLFRSMNVELPFLTVAVLWVSNFLKNNLITILVALALSLILLKILRDRTYTVGYAVDRALLSTPIVKTIIYNGQLALISEYMRILISSGATIDRTLELVEELSGNKVFQKALSRVKERVTLGESISSSFGKEKVFPRFLVRMIRSGEESGLLDEQLAFAAEFYYERLHDISQKIGKMIEPIMLIVVGAIFAIIMMALFLPIYDLLGKIVK